MLSTLSTLLGSLAAGTGLGVGLLCSGTVPSSSALSDTCNALSSETTTPSASAPENTERPTSRPVSAPSRPAPADTESSARQASGAFRTEGSRILDSNGRDFIVKGINFANYQGPGGSFNPNSITPAHMDEIVRNIADVWKFNAVRYASYLFPEPGSDASDGGPPGAYGIPNEALIKKMTDKGLVVMINPHDNTGGYYRGEQAEALKNYWREMAIKYKDNPNVWFDLFNEPGGKSELDSQAWVALNQELIQIIRDEVGAQNPILITEHDWGHGGPTAGADGGNPEDSVLLSRGREVTVMNGKRYTNLIATAHPYEPFEGEEARLDQYVTKLQDDLGLPVVMGEYGTFGGEVTTAFNEALNVADRKKAGRMVWTYRDGDSNDLTRDGDGGIDTTRFLVEGQPGNLTDLGRRVWDDTHRPG